MGDKPQPQRPWPVCSTCNQEARCIQTKKENDNFGRWFFKCPNEHKNPWFWADTWQEQHAQQHAQQQHQQPPQHVPHTPQQQRQHQYGSQAGASTSGHGQWASPAGGGYAAPPQQPGSPARQQPQNWQVPPPPYAPGPPQQSAHWQQQEHRPPPSGPTTPATPQGFRAPQNFAAPPPAVPYGYGQPQYGPSGSAAYGGAGGTQQPPQPQQQQYQQQPQGYGYGSQGRSSQPEGQGQGVPMSQAQQQQQQQPTVHIVDDIGKGHEVTFVALRGDDSELGLRTAYHPPFNDLVKRLDFGTSRRRWVPEERQWRVRASCYHQVDQLLREHGYVTKTPPDVLARVGPSPLNHVHQGAGWPPHQEQHFPQGPPQQPPPPQQQHPSPPPQQQQPQQSPQQQQPTPQHINPDGVGRGVAVEITLPCVASSELGLTLSVGYHAPFRDVIMQLDYAITGRRYDKSTKLWLVKATEYPQVREHLNDNGYEVKDAPPQVIDVLISRSSPYNPRMSYGEAEEVVRCRLGPELLGRLFRYQSDGVVAGVRFEGRLLLADEMGLGKTVQALCIAACYAEDWPLLVVCPPSLRYAWAQAIADWLPPALRPAPRDLWMVTAAADWNALAQQAGIDLEGDAAAAAAGRSGGPYVYGRGAARPHIAIASYDIVAKLDKKHAARYRFVICDESHSLKDRTTKRYDRVGPLVRGAARAVLCTGTPIMNRPIEIWPQSGEPLVAPAVLADNSKASALLLMPEPVDLLRQGLLGSYREYGERYCVQQQQHHSQQQGQGRQQQQQAAGGYPGSEFRFAVQGRLPELHALLAECVMVRRLKRDVLPDLPDKIRSKVPLQPSDSDLAEVRRCLAQLQAVREEEQAGRLAGRQADDARSQAWMAAYRATGPAKVPEALSFIDRILERQQQGPAGAEEAAGHDGAGPSSQAAGGAAADAAVSDKLIVFAHHREVMDRIEAHLKDTRTSYVRIDGEVSPAQRHEAVARFQAAPTRGSQSARVALLSLHAAGVGLTLTAASTVVFVELDPNPMTLQQAEDRAHRVGQRSCVHVYYLIGRGTLDDSVWAMVANKLAVVDRVLGDGEQQQQQHGQQAQQQQAFQQGFQPSQQQQYPYSQGQQQAAGKHWGDPGRAPPAEAEGWQPGADGGSQPQSQRQGWRQGGAPPSPVAMPAAVPEYVAPGSGHGDGFGYQYGAGGGSQGAGVGMGVGMGGAAPPPEPVWGQAGGGGVHGQGGFGGGIGSQRGTMGGTGVGYAAAGGGGGGGGGVGEVEVTAGSPVPSSPSASPTASAGRMGGGYHQAPARVQHQGVQGHGAVGNEGHVAYSYVGPAGVGAGSQQQAGSDSQRRSHVSATQVSVDLTQDDEDEDGWLRVRGGAGGGGGGGGVGGGRRGGGAGVEVVGVAYGSGGGNGSGSGGGSGGRGRGAVAGGSAREASGGNGRKRRAGEVPVVSLLDD